jgi:hypothetical protein
MKRSASLTLVVALTLLSLLLLAPEARAQAESVGNGLYRIEGTVIGVNKKASTISIRQRSHANMAWTIHYDEKTSFSYRNAESSLDDVKNGRRIICLGRYEEKGGKNEMVAVVVDVRTGR